MNHGWWLTCSAFTQRAQVRSLRPLSEKKFGPLRHIFEILVRVGWVHGPLFLKKFEPRSPLCETSRNSTISNLHILIKFLILELPLPPPILHEHLSKKIYTTLISISSFSSSSPLNFKLLVLPSEVALDENIVKFKGEPTGHLCVRRAFLEEKVSKQFEQCIFVTLDSPEPSLGLCQRRWEARLAGQEKV